MQVTGPMATDVKSTSRVIAILVVLSILPYVNALDAGFTLDDLPNIRDNPAVTKGIDPTEIFAPRCRCLPISTARLQS